MATYDFDIGILGGGSAGLTIAAGSAMLGAKTLLIEKEAHLGGDCLHYGCVPSKTLIKTAHVYHLMKQAQKFGLPAVQLTPVDYKEVAKRIQSVIAVIQKHDSAERFCKLGARVEFGAARFVDPHVVRMDGQTFSAKNWVIATGSSPAMPNIEGLANTPHLTNRDIFSLDHLPESLIVIGGGPIGIEMAQAFARLGSRVTVIQHGGQILSKEDKDMADLVLQALQREGVTVHLNAEILRTQDLGNSREVVIKTGGQEFALQSEMLLAAAGRNLNLAELGLESIDVEFDRRGLKLDARLRSVTQPHIYGAGDVTGQYLFTHAAGYEGGIVIRNAIFHLPSKVDYTNLPWCTYTDPELASIGMNEKGAQAAGITYSVWTEPFRSNDRSLAEGEEVGLIKLVLDEKERPLGVQILGPHAGELVSEWVAIMNGKAKLSTMASAVHPYPTLGEINKRVIGNLFAGKVYSDKVKKGLKFFFNLRGRACGAEDA
ncbi:tRNA uridine 5-carboxymethylaminomethyl modification enzyme GidA [Candidatus Vecturithrix granuli]|uniref:tRNA uridine 5-carboxymethylaminomethyl modification enzyme GidA n=1 Tax=Vecturithrix granuli TaxID=1499967 RepID=A0A081CAF4_VECG1|nr:tRNA uridine 5-carboxymethylaminomethyl modification enzyme GidA [Candidatus Vecturithrix granuli]